MPKAIDKKYLISSLKAFNEQILSKTYIASVEYANTESVIGDTPVGHIISYMGTTAPKHYLVCDGAVYNITDYPHLTEHFRKELGSVNYFGGDGITTFAVPDLRGEFLRGTGTAARNTGTGANVGVHQNPTKHTAIGFNSTEKTFWIDGGTFSDGATTRAMENPDLIMYGSYSGCFVNTTSFRAVSGVTEFTARPTNTSVLYCIKYEPTYYMSVAKEVYSTEERVIGTWIDGKPLYKKTLYKDAVHPGTETSVGIIENIKDVISFEGSIKRATNGFIRPLMEYSGSGDTCCTAVGVYGNTLFMYAGEDVIDVYITIKYTKTTD